MTGLGRVYCREPLGEFVAALLLAVVVVPLAVGLLLMEWPVAARAWEEGVWGLFLASLGFMGLTLLLAVLVAAYLVHALLCLLEERRHEIVFYELCASC